MHPQPLAAPERIHRIWPLGRLARHSPAAAFHLRVYPQSAPRTAAALRSLNTAIHLAQLGIRSDEEKLK
jgi:hypothetical protein